MLPNPSVYNLVNIMLIPFLINKAYGSLFHFSKHRMCKEYLHGNFRNFSDFWIYYPVYIDSLQRPIS